MSGYPPYGGAGFGRGMYGYSRPPARGGFRGSGRYVSLFINIYPVLINLIKSKSSHICFVLLCCTILLIFWWL
jgi:hypothetical protein